MLVSTRSLFLLIKFSSRFKTACSRKIKNTRRYFKQAFRIKEVNFCRVFNFCILIFFASKIEPRIIWANGCLKQCEGARKQNGGSFISSVFERWDALNFRTIRVWQVSSKVPFYLFIIRPWRWEGFQLFMKRVIDSVMCKVRWTICPRCLKWASLQKKSTREAYTTPNK